MTTAIASTTIAVPPALSRSIIRVTKIGAIAGGTTVFGVAIGFIEVAERVNIITDYLTLGITLILIAAVLAGYFAGRIQDTSRRPWRALLQGAFAGLVGGSILAVFVVIATSLPLQEVFPNIKPTIITTISFGTEPPVSILVHAGAGAVLGTLGAAVALMARIPRRVISVALTTTLLIAVLERLLRVMFTELGPLEAVADFLYSGGGLTVPGAITVFLIAGGLTLLWELRRDAVRGRLNAMDTDQRKRLRLGSFVAFAFFLVVLPQIIGPFPSDVLNAAGLFILLGLGLNIVVGFAGMLDLGYVAFFAIGAYTVAFLTSPLSFFGLEASFWVVLPVVIVLAALAGLVIGAPVLRLRGDYLAIVTLGFGEIVRLLFISDWLKPYTGGGQGVLSIPPPSLIGDWPSREPQEFYYVILGFCLLAALLAVRLADSRVGRAWNAMREDETVAAATGISTTNYKLLAFALGAVFAGVAGALYAARIGIILPSSFSILVSITALSLIILGGMGTIRGVIVGALVLVGLPELLREFDQYRLLIYGALLVAMMLLRPEGLLPNAIRRLELHEGEALDEVVDESAEASTTRPAEAGQAG